MAERRIDLRFFGGGIFVGRIASMTERDRRFEFGFGELREVAAQCFSVATHFVDRAVIAQGGNMDGQFTLKLRGMAATCQ